MLSGIQQGGQSLTGCAMGLYRCHSWRSRLALRLPQSDSISNYWKPAGWWSQKKWAACEVVAWAPQAWTHWNNGSETIAQNGKDGWIG